MIEITPQQRRALRAKAHHLHPVVTVGQAGLTPQVLHEVDIALRAHGLIKVRVFSDDRDEREAMLTQIADDLDAAPVQHLGKLLILWRPQEEAAEEEKKASKPARKSASRERAASEPVARRARGPGSSDSGDAASRRRRARVATQGPASTSQREPRGRSVPNPRRRRRSV